MIKKIIYLSILGGEFMRILNVATQPISMEFETQNTALDLNIVPPQLQLDTEAAKLEIRQPKGTLEIDGTPFRYSYGIKNWQSFSRDNAQDSRNAGLQAIAEIAQEGDRMALIESKEEAVVAIAAQTNFPEMRELTWAPLEKPDIHYTLNRPQTNFIPGKFDLNLQRGSVQNNYQPGKVDISITQYPSIRMWTSEPKVDLML
jgi:hypothetical protein